MISAVLVSYRSGALAVRAIESLRREAREAALELEVVAVVNSGESGEVEILRRAADVVLDPGENLGYAGGLNRGLSVARGETLLFCNPDLVLGRGALLPLVRAVQGGDRVAAGPAFFLDEAHTLLIPVLDEPHPLDLARRRLALDPRRSEALFRRDVRRIRKAALAAHDGATVGAPSLSGALFAVSRSTLDLVGPFDEGYRLYYEENDWQRRLRLAGGRLRYVGAARVVHFYNRSARLEPQAAAWFAESERRYFDKHFGARGRDALARLADAAPWPVPAPAPIADGALRFDAGTALAVAVSPLPYFRPFLLSLVAPGAGAWRPPEELLRSIGAEPWFARVFELSSGRVVGEARIEAESRVRETA